MHRSVFVGGDIGLGAGGKTPVSEWLLLPFGYVDVDRPVAGGPFTFTRAQADTLVDWFARQGRALAIDYEHQTFDDCNTRPDGLSPAAGWIHGLEARQGGLWVTGVTWSEKASALLAAGEYRYFSPVIFREGDSYTIPTSMGPVALTNDPSMLGTVALAAKQDDDRRCDASTGRSRRLVARQHTGVQVMNEIFTLLGIDPENPTIDAIEAALTDEKLPTAAALLGLGEEPARADVLAAIGAMLGVAQATAPEAEAEATPEQAAEQAVTAVKRLVEHCLALGRKRAAGEIGKALGVKGETVQGVVALAKNKLANPPGHVSSAENKKTLAENAKLQTRLEALEEKDTEREFDALVLNKFHDGKIVPAKRGKYLDLFKSLGKGDFEELVLKAMPPKVSDKSVFAGDGSKSAKRDEKDPYERKIDEIVAKEKVTKLVAMRKAQQECPELFAAYRKSRRVAAGAWIEVRPETGLGATRTTQTALTDTVTVTAAQLLTKVLDGTPTAAATYTLPTAALLMAAMRDAKVGDSFDFVVNNKSGGANTITVAAGAGGTADGTLTVAQNVIRTFKIIVTNVTAASEAYFVYGIG